MSLRSLRGIALAATLLLVFSPTAEANDDDASRAEELNDQGKKRIQQLDLEGAAEFFRQAIALSTDPRYYFNLCYTLEKSGKLVEAREACDAVAGTGNPRLENKAEQLSLKIDERLGPRPTEPSGPTPNEPQPPDGQGNRVPPPPPPPEKPPEPAPKLAYGGVVGMSLANVSGGPSSSQVVGAAVGAWLRLPLANHYDIILDGQYVQRGTTSDVMGFGIGTLSTGYVDFGAAFRYGFGAGAMSYYLEAGMALSILVAESGTFDGLDVETNVTGKDIASVFGFGYLLDIGAGAIDFRFRYMIGYLGIDEISGPGDPKLVNRTFLFQGGYWY